MGPLQAELRVALQAARDAGAAILRYYGAGPGEVTAKPDGTPVTRADLAANEVLVSAVRAGRLTRLTVELRDLADYVGLDSSYAIAGIMFDDFREARFAPPPLLKRMVVAGLFGRKSGRGFYDWSTNPPS